MEPTLNLEQPSVVGRVIANHRLVTEIGSGGMGKVYYAEHTVIGRRAAIKILNPEISKDAAITSRFLNEAKAVNEIRHPNVVEITDLGREGDLHYIVMQFLEGETLGERLERVKVMDEPSALRMARQVSSALGAAHEHNIIHRDLKPDNIFLTNHPDFPDYVKVLDFGIAKLRGAGSGTAGTEHKLTRAGMVLGTPSFMSPEQCRGTAAIDARSDIYALGVVLYQVLTGLLPFVSENIMEVMIAHCTTPPVAPVNHNPAISAHVNAAILKAMEKDPEKRFPNMRAFWEALENLPSLEAPPEPAAATPARAADPSVAEAPAAPPPTETTQQRGIRGVADKLTDIISTRIANDRLVVPTMPAIAVECLKVVRDPRQTFKSVGEVIAKDPVLSSRVLKLANSAAFPGLTPANTLEAAIARMGIEGLTVILVQYSVYQAFTSRDERIRSSFRGIWEHSLAVALIAKDLATRLIPSGPDPSAAYLAGLLHDVGKPVVASLLLEAEKALGANRKGGASTGWIDESIWRKIVGESHRKVGVKLAEQWKLPAEVVSTIDNCKAYDRMHPRSCANVVRLANALAKRSGLYVGDTTSAEIDKTVEAGQHIVGLGAEAVAKSCKDIYARVATMLDSRGAKK